MICTGFIHDAYATSRLVKFSIDSALVDIDYARDILTHADNPNEFTWNTIMRGYVQRNHLEKAILLYKLMLNRSGQPDNYTYPILIQASAASFQELEGKQLHVHVMYTGFDSDVYVVNTLINMYAVCGNINDARKVFDESPVVDIVSWNSILAGYVQMGIVEEAKFIYNTMPKRSIIASNSMIAMLGKTGHVNEAARLFNTMIEKDTVSWTALISCYEQNGMYEEALILFKNMRLNAVRVDEVVMVSVLSACTHLSIAKVGKLVHGISVKVGLDGYVNLQNSLIHMHATCGDIASAQELFDTSSHLDQISWNSMISGYLKCGSVEKARALFDVMPVRDVVSWSAMISGYTQHLGMTLDLFKEMQIHGVEPDETTLVSVLTACTHLGALEQGQWIHGYIKKNNLIINFILGTTLIDMYMKCGHVENAVEVFDGMRDKAVSTWNAFIQGMALNGLVEESLGIFSDMKKSGVIPNEITFMAVLAACRHMGLVDEGRNHFNSMIQEHKLEPNVKHYGCMVDLLGRAGLLKEAEDLLTSMPIEPDVATWGALLGACKKHGDKEMGERIGRKLINLHPDHDGFHVLLSNIFASKGNWDDVIGIRLRMVKESLVKTPGCSMIEAEGSVHEFTAGDKSHPRMVEINDMLDEMWRRLKAIGYAPDMNEVFLEIDEEEKETALLRHSEKLAVAFGLIAVDSSMPIRIMKNLRICNDCHEAIKLVSCSFNREIVVRDRHRFHHFKEGVCSCRDYW